MKVIHLLLLQRHLDSQEVTHQREVNQSICVHNLVLAESGSGRSISHKTRSVDVTS